MSSNKSDKFADIIRESARKAGTIGMTPSMLLQATLPHSDPGDVPVYKVTNGNYSLFIKPHFDVDEDGEYVSTGIPYGGLARLFIAYITTRVKRTGQRTIDLGKTQSEFMRRLEIGRSGGETGRIRYLQDQLMRLAYATITFEKRTRDGDAVKVEGENVPFARRYQFWWLENENDSKSDFKGKIVLDEEFRDELMRSSIPVDFRMLQVLRQSPMAMDLYTWITYRQDTRWRQAQSEPLVVPWKALHQQFGAGYKNTRDFAVKARKQLKKIDELWPEMKYETPRGRLKLYLFPPHVGASQD